MLHQMNIKATNNFERNGAPYEQKTSACKEQSSWIPFNTKFVDTHQTNRNTAKRCPFPVLAQRSTRDTNCDKIILLASGEITQAVSLVSLENPVESFATVEPPLPPGGSNGTFGWGVQHLVWVRTLFKTWTPVLKRGIFQQNPTLFQNQMVKIYIKFQTKTAKNPWPLATHIPMRFV